VEPAQDTNGGGRRAHDGVEPSRWSLVAATVTFVVAALVLNAVWLQPTASAPIERTLAAAAQKAELLELSSAREQAHRIVEGSLGGGRPLVVAGVDGPVVVLAGDSVMENLTPLLLPTLTSRYGAEVRVRTVLGSTLDEDLLMDWESELGDLAAGADIVYLSLTPEVRPDIDSERWVAAVDERVRRVAAVVSAQGARLVWVGAMRSTAAVEQRFVDWDSVLARLDGEGAIDYIAIAGVVDGGSGTFVVSIDVDGRQVEVRNRDGVHLTARGARLVADFVVESSNDLLIGEP
jgi:hypothetical protein